MLLMKDIIDDSNELIRTVSKEVELPLSQENHDLLMKMHEFLVASQDEELSEKYDLRPAVGIAAIQLGIPKRMCAIHVLDYDEDGNVVIAANGTAPLLGLSIIEGGYNDISGTESGKVKKGDDLEIQIKDIGYAIASAEIKKGQDYFQILEGLSGKRVMLTIYDPSTKKEWEEYVKPTTYGNQNGLLYNRWVKQRQEMVEKLSNGKIGYVHVKSMDSPSFRKVYSEILGKYRNKEAIIVDTRYNGGGWLHEDLLHLLSGKKYAEFVPRGQFIGEDPFTQWNKPSAVLVSESNYSNAHGFPWAYKELGLGKVIGMPVPGTMTAVWWETLMDPSLVFGIPQVGMKDNQGRILENMQLEPDIKVTNDPASAMKGRDLQLEAAVESLMKEIK